MVFFIFSFSLVEVKTADCHVVGRVVREVEIARNWFRSNFAVVLLFIIFLYITLQRCSWKRSARLSPRFLQAAPTPCESILVFIPTLLAPLEMSRATFLAKSYQWLKGAYFKLTGPFHQVTSLSVTHRTL